MVRYADSSLGGVGVVFKQAMTGAVARGGGGGGGNCMTLAKSPP